MSEVKPMEGFATRRRTHLSRPTKAPQKTKRMLVVSTIYCSTLPVGGGEDWGVDEWEV